MVVPVSPMTTANNEIGMCSSRFPDGV